MITVFSTVKIYIPVNTQSFSTHHSLNTSHAYPQFLFSLDPILPVHRFERIRQVWGTERHLPPWVPVSCQTFHTVPGLLPPCPFYFSFLPPSENLKPMSTPSVSIRIPTVHLSSQEPCISLPWLMFLCPQLLKESRENSCPSPKLCF